MELNINIHSTIRLIPKWDGTFRKHPTKKNKLQFSLWFLFLELTFKNR